jgi:hypothetical protein
LLGFLQIQETYATLAKVDTTALSVEEKVTVNILFGSLNAC